MPNVSTVTGYTSAAVVTGGTIAVSYPTGTTRGDFVLGMRHRLSVLGKVFSCPEAITVSLGATTATITYNGTTTIPSGTRYTVELDRNTSFNPIATPSNAVDTYIKPGLTTYVHPLSPLLINLGTPTTASATAVCASQAVAGAGALVITGGAKYSAALGAAALGAPTGRNVNVVSSSASDTAVVITVTGTDMYGQTMRENITCNGTTTVQGKKAFFTVTGVASGGAAVGNISVGDGTIIGLPIYLSNSVFVIKEVQDGAVATSGTLVAGAGITVPSTATSADVRGTYTPNSAPDGTRSYALCVDLPEQAFFGQPQY